MMEIRQIYNSTEKRMLPVHDRIMDALHDGSENLSLAEAIGLLEIIKFELLAEASDVE